MNFFVLGLIQFYSGDNRLCEPVVEEVQVHVKSTSLSYLSAFYDGISVAVLSTALKRNV